MMMMMMMMMMKLYSVFVISGSSYNYCYHPRSKAEADNTYRVDK